MFVFHSTFDSPPIPVETPEKPLRRRKGEGRDTYRRRLTRVVATEVPTRRRITAHLVIFAAFRSVTRGVNFSHVPSLAAWSGLSEAQVRRGLATLEAAGVDIGTEGGTR